MTYTIFLQSSRFSSSGEGAIRQEVKPKPPPALAAIVPPFIITRTLSRTSPAIQCHRHWLPCQPTLSMVRTDACRDSYRTFEGAAVEVE
ncbi:hypothetical protein JTE90_002550 [Oedothorax gibbosus]|uniref:Uncharacterized protein n=1 Tax=Oedothorax gibbosus TaxID=931172 RepID=A0AAV6V2P6_9ARAC|nr:hypothetical protein JTE90_002550 [Oedothorax gibbosus]